MIGDVLLVSGAASPDQFPLLLRDCADHIPFKALAWMPPFAAFLLLFRADAWSPLGRASFYYRHANGIGIAPIRPRTLEDEQVIGGATVT